MRLARGDEVRLDADVELLRADPEPDPAAASERLRLLDLREPEKRAEERACGVLATGGGGEATEPVTPRVTPDGEWYDEGGRRSLDAW